MKKRIYIDSILLITVIIIINILSGNVNLSIDFTKDNIHAISKQSKTILENLEDKIFIKVYLDGDYPAEFKHLQNCTYDLLKRFKEISPELIDFEFIDPNDSYNDKQKLALFQQLIKKGLSPTDLEIRSVESSVNKIIFPGAIIYYKEKHIAVNFLKNQIAKKHTISVSDLESKIKEWKTILMRERDKRIRPGLDDKSLTSWNGLMLKGYIDAYMVFRKEKHLEIALKNAN